MRRMMRVGLLCAVVAVWASAAPARAATASAPWPQFQGDARHLGVNGHERTLNTSNVADLSLSWVGQVGGDLDWTSPVVARGNVYIAGGDSGLNVFPSTGCGAATCDPSWTGQTGPQAIATPAVAGPRVFVPSQASFTSNDGRLNVFDADGCAQSVCQPLWQGIAGTESFLVSSPAVADGVVYVGAFDGRVYAYDVHGCGAATCQPLWAGVSGSPIDSSPAVGNGIVYVGSTDGTVSAFDAAGCGAATCQPLWQDRTGGGIDIASPTVAGDVLLVSGGDFLFAFDSAGCGEAVCDPLWKGNAELMSNTPAVSNGFVFVDAQPLLGGGRAIGTIAVFRLSGCGATVCNPVWSGVNFATGAESSPMVANGVVYIGKGPASGFPVDSGVFMYDARGCGKALCQPIAFVQTTDQQFYLSSTPAVVDGRVYMGSTETNSNQAGLYVWELP